MTLNLKRADESEQEAINTLIIKSEMASMGNAGNPSAFVRQYSISQRALLTNDSYVLYEGQNLVGFFMLTRDGVEHELAYFYIEHTRLGKGYGKILWGFMEGVCVQNRIHKINFVCGKNVTGFYLKMGAKKIGETTSKAYVGVEIDCLQYELELGKGPNSG